MDSFETRGTGMLPPRRLGDPPYRPIVIRFGIDQALQLRIRGQLAHFRTPRPPERSRIGSQRRYAARPPLRTMSRDTVDARALPLMWAFTMARRRIRCDRTAEGPLPPTLGRLRRVCDYRQRSWFSAYRRQSGFTQVQGSTGERPELEFIL